MHNVSEIANWSLFYGVIVIVVAVMTASVGWSTSVHLGYRRVSALVNRALAAEGKPVASDPFRPSRRPSGVDATGASV
jgi:hypothetical protein